MTTASIDQAAYSLQREQFLLDYFKFRKGNLSSGHDALNHLASMFYCLPANRYFTKDEKAAIEFLERINRLEEKLEQYEKEHNVNGAVKVPELIKELDGLLREFYKIMSVCEYSR